jgi:hypothetical protein
VAAPWGCKGTYFFDTRFIIMLGFLLFGALLPSGLPRFVNVGAVAAFTLLFLLRMTVLGYAWHETRHDLAELRAVIAPVQPGSRVLLVDVTHRDAPRYWHNVPLDRQLSFGFDLDTHLPALLLIERRAYWPYLFDNPSQQPIETRQPYRALAERAPSIANYRKLAVRGQVDLCGYGYVLLLNAGGAPNLALAPKRLALVASSDIAALFRVRRGACGSPQPSPLVSTMLQVNPRGAAGSGSPCASVTRVPVGEPSTLRCS